ncbi:MAG: adenylyl-sulfate kinase [Alphaproteobacteria bacterium]|nr:adenylyl-sulfate kinase [Alphaproteobacteria bacterium]
MGLPGSGKTTLAGALVPRLGAVHFNADEVRQNVNKDLGYSEQDRIEQARRMGWLCDQVVKSGGTVVAEFICPTAECRDAFRTGGDAFIVWVDRADSCQYEDTNQLFSPPNEFDVRVTREGSAEDWAEQIERKLRSEFDREVHDIAMIDRAGG